MNVTFQPAQAEDANVIFCLAKQLVRRYENPSVVDIPKVERWMQQKVATYIHSYQRILLNDIVVGYFRLEDQNDRTELDDFYILPEYQGQGIGTLVMQHCLQTAKHPIYLYVFCENRRAIAFYRRCGLQISDRVSDTRVIMAQKVDS